MKYVEHLLLNTFINLITEFRKKILSSLITIAKKIIIIIIASHLYIITKF